MEKKPKKEKYNGRAAITVLIDRALLQEFDAINRKKDGGVGGGRIRAIACLIEKFVAEHRSAKDNA